MPQEKNTLLRVLVPVGVLLAGIAIAAAVLMSKSPKAPAAAAPPASAPTGQAPPAAEAGAPATAGQTPAPAPAEGAPAVGPIAGLHAVAIPADPAARNFDTIGSTDEKSEFQMGVEFSTVGAGVRALRLAKMYESITREHHVLLQQERPYWVKEGPDTDRLRSVLTPLALTGVEINGQFVALSGAYEDATRGFVGDPVWRQVAPGRFEALIADGAGVNVARVERAYALPKGSYALTLSQKVENLSPDPMTVTWYQIGPADLPLDAMSYGGDKRRVRFGYLLKPAADPSRQFVVAKDFLWQRAQALGDRDKATGWWPDEHVLWPNETSKENGYELVWAGLTNRYFGVAFYPPDAGIPPPGAALPDKRLAGVDEVGRYLQPSGTADPHMGLRFRSAPMAVAPGASAGLDLGVYAGPLSRPVIRSEPGPEAAGLEDLVVYNFGGPCGPCTFPFLTGALLWLLHFLHDTVLHDWALAIIVLVVCVRTCLHPVTRWSQIRLTRFGKQMQSMAPKQKKLQEKFKDDPKRMRDEMAKLWREEGVNPAGALGCLPMFLQTPVWIALYAMLYFAVELRHQPAFFGVFQRLSGNKWTFLGDLAEPDRFWYFGHVLFNAPLLGPIESVNILPLILGVVFFIQQKYLTPPSSAPLTPEQETQQKMMKVMMVVMFPLFMYNAPSGLALYFIVNSTLGILESKWIRSHVDKMDKLHPPGPRPAKKGGFMQRLQQMAEDRRKMLESRASGFRNTDRRR